MFTESDMHCMFPELSFYCKIEDIEAICVLCRYFFKYFDSCLWNLQSTGFIPAKINFSFFFVKTVKKISQKFM